MLRVYRNDVTDWVIAESPEDATKVLGEAGCPMDPGDAWVECDPETEWTLQEGAPECPITRRFRDWIQVQGRGFLGTTEY